MLLRDLQKNLLRWPGVGACLVSCGQNGPVSSYQSPLFYLVLIGKENSTCSNNQLLLLDVKNAHINPN